MFFHWLFSLLICAAFAVYVIAPDFSLRCYASAESALGSAKLRVLGIVLLALYAALAVAQAYLIFRRGKRVERGFINMDSGDSGRVRIAVSAVEQMVRQSVNSIDGIEEMKIGIDNQDDAIDIVVNASVISGSHVPTITTNMQRSIRQFVETNCGVAVRSVSISINAVSNAQPARRRLGHRKPEPVAPAAQTIEPSGDEVYSEAHDSPDAPSVEADAVENGPVAVEPDPVTYDFEKPYVSEFEKDLAAMRAGEADGRSGEHDEVR